MIASSLNVVLRVEFISNKCQCLLIIYFTFRNVLLYVITKGILLWPFSSTLVLVMCLSIPDSHLNSASKFFLLKPNLTFLRKLWGFHEHFLQANSWTIWYTPYQWSRISRGRYSVKYIYIYLYIYKYIYIYI